MYILKVLHWFIAIMVWISAFIVPKSFLPFALFVQISVMMSWLITNRCILWDIQKKFDPNLKISSDTTSAMLGIDRPTWLMITHTMIYLNTILLGYRMNKFSKILAFVIAYICINCQYLHRGDDDLNKY